MTKAMIDTACWTQSRIVFQANYKEKQFTFRGPFVGVVKNGIEGLDKWILIQNFDTIKKFSTNFADLITQLHVSFDEIDAAQSKAIINLINVQCSGVLQQLTFDHFQGNNQLKIQLMSVFKFTFSSSQTAMFDTNSNGIKWNRIFPNLEI